LCAIYELRKILCFKIIYGEHLNRNTEWKKVIELFTVLQKIIHDFFFKLYTVYNSIVYDSFQNYGYISSIDKKQKIGHFFSG